MIDFMFHYRGYNVRIQVYLEIVCCILL